MLTIGKRGGRDFRLTAEQRSRHLHVVGASGTGKSKFLEMLIQQDILARRGVCLIDPHGSLADAIIRFCASRDIGRYRRIHIIEPSDADWCFGFNPLHADGIGEPTLRVDTMVDTCAEVWGGEDIDKTPLLTTCLELVFYALVANRLTLLEAVALTQSADINDIRGALTKKLPDTVYSDYWNDVRTLPRRELEERFASTRRRLLRFLGRPIVRRIVGQRDNVLNLRQVMDDGEILIVNLASQRALSPTSARLLGAMLTSEFYLTALSRPVELGRKQPYYLYIDECYDYLTGDIERMLDETRKFGLHLVLAHQRLGQLRARSDAIYNGVMGGAQTKIVFGGLADEDADIMAHEIMRNSFNLERPKHSLDRPVAIGQERIWLESFGSGQASVEGSGSVEGASWNEFTGASETVVDSFRFAEGADPTHVGTQVVAGMNSGAGHGGFSATNQFSAQATSTMRGQHEALATTYQVMSVQLHSLEEEVHRAIVRLREQPNQRAIIKLRGQKAKGVVIPEIKPPLVRPERIEQFRALVRQQSAYLTSRPAVEAEIEQRHADLGITAAQVMRDDVPPPFEEPKWS